MNTDRIVSISAIVVAMGTLFIITYQTSLMRDTAKASVLPYLEIYYGRNGSEAHLFLANTGVGPALINRIFVNFQGEIIEGDPYVFIVQTHKRVQKLSRDRVMNGMLVPSGKHIRMLGVNGSDKTAQLIADTFAVNGMSATRTSASKGVIKIEYSSIYGDKWIISSDQYVPLEF